MKYVGYVTKMICQTAKHMYTYVRYVRYVIYVRGVMSQMRGSASHILVGFMRGKLRVKSVPEGPSITMDSFISQWELSCSVPWLHAGTPPE